MTHDSEYFRRRAEEARATVYSKDQEETGDIAGDLALAYSALARRRAAASENPSAIPLDEPA
jgi:hypothetical protein